MSSRRSARAVRRSALAAMAAVLAACGPARAADEAKFHLRPGATGKVCLGCHVDLEELLRQPVVHPPVKEGDCTDCHSPHAAEHEKLLKAPVEALCATCHGAMISEGAASAHEPVREGRCISCHSPHASANKALLVRAGNDLCLGCHEEKKSALAAATHRHAPVDRDCLGCHDPHASKDSKWLLRKAVPALCLGCHKPDQPGFARAHMDQPVAGADCTSCHDPHGSKNAGILWATVHEPVRNRLCAQCHGEPAGGRVTLKRAGADLCRGCHNDLFLDIGSKDRVHWPVVDRTGCFNCHVPHASRTPALLSAPQKQLCGGCHPDSVERQERSLTKHPPVEEGECTACHLPHAADATFLFASADLKEVCGTCHDWSGHSAHPIGDAAVDQRNPNLHLSCESCHRAHGTAYKYFTHGDVKGQLCMGCHTDITR